jgi:hypothetical protein
VLAIGVGQLLSRHAELPTRPAAAHAVTKQVLSIAHCHLLCCPCCHCQQLPECRESNPSRTPLGHCAGTGPVSGSNPGTNSGRQIQPQLPTLMRSLLSLTPSLRSASSVCMTQLKATSLDARLVRTMCGMLYLARLAWDALLVSSTALPLQRNSTLGISMLRSLPAHNEAQHSTAHASAMSALLRSPGATWPICCRLLPATATHLYQLQQGAGAQQTIAWQSTPPNTQKAAAQQPAKHACSPQ